MLIGVNSLNETHGEYAGSMKPRNWCRYEDLLEPPGLCINCGWQRVEFIDTKVKEEEQVREKGKPFLRKSPSCFHVMNPEGWILYSFSFDGFQSFNFNHGGYWYEVRRNTYPSDEDFSLYQITLIHGTA
jgi:hypothetical protein